MDGVLKILWHPNPQYFATDVVFHKPSTSYLVARIARPASLAIWHPAIASQAKLKRESESQALRIARSLKTCRFFRIAGQHRRIFAGIFLLFSCDFRSSEWAFASLVKNIFHIASDLGVCDSNRIAHRGCIARFGPLRFRSWNMLSPHCSRPKSKDRGEDRIAKKTYYRNMFWASGA